MIKFDQKIISCGYSCQTRYSIDYVNADHRRMPFDFNITTRTALLEALMTDGKSLVSSVDSCEIFTMPVQQRQGIKSKNVYWWHDYPIKHDKKTLDQQWLHHIDRINDKYQVLWQRFLTLLRSSDIRKTLLISNSQFNLDEFSNSAEDFIDKFGLEYDFYLDFNRTLHQIGGKNYSVIFLNRTINDVEDFYKKNRQDDFDMYFVGKMKLPSNARLINSIIGNIEADSDVRRILGRYESDFTIELSAKNRALIYRRNSSGLKDIWGSVIPASGGYYATFKGQDKTFSVIMEGNKLRFDNKTHWNRTSNEY